MLEFFREGGWGMYPVLVFGLVLLASAARYAWDLEPARLRFSVVMSLLVLAASAHAMLTDVAQVFWFVQSRERAPDDELARIVMQGLMESTRPGGLGGALVTLALVLVAIGVYRGGRRELRAAGA